MADIIDPQVIKWSNEKARPFAETLLVLLLQSKELTANYDEKIAPLVAGNVGTDLLEDGRAAEGVSRLTASDLSALLAVANNLNALATPAVFTTVRKPVVRKIEIGV